MADFQTFDLGHVLGSAAQIQGMRDQSSLRRLQEQYMGTQIQGAQQTQALQAAEGQRQQTQFNDQQRFTNTRTINVAAHAVASDPTAANQWLPVLKENGLISADFDPAQHSPQEIQQLASTVATNTDAILGAYMKSDPSMAKVDAEHQAKLAEITAQGKAQLADTQERGKQSRLTNAAIPDVEKFSPYTNSEGQTVLIGDRGTIKPTDVMGAGKGGAGAAGLGGREGVMFQRVANSANSALEALKNISELPTTVSGGIFGASKTPGPTLAQSVKNVLTNKLSSQDVQDYNTMIAGVSRNLSTIETAGLAPNGSLTHSMDSLTMVEGETGMTKLRKLAEMRQIIIKGIETNIDNPKLPQPQKDLIQRIIDQTKEAIPFTQHDITQLQRRQTADPQATLQDLMKEKGLASGTVQRVKVDAQGNVIQ
jgi:hypothetical protein